jgi:alkanesulfonate monooxygenase SsuD/methylene tetrahydromethanopterin reductase-like flavin-dependent oxidoreductase (luciferase family)
MRVWHFTEQSYTPGWEKVDGTIRITPPSRVIEPEVASDLLNRFLDEWAIADELGLDIMVNEHHSTMSCLSSSVALPLAILAKNTKKARLLCLGVPMTNRMDPFRVAEELALIDVISRGRLEFGLVKGTPWELFSSNMNPARLMDRLWEAHDLIVKALTTQDGPFSWEGEYFQYRYVNVYPRCYQQPMPPMWMPTSGPATARKVAEKGYVVATFMAGYHAKNVFDAYRETYRQVFGSNPALDRLAYLGMAVVGHDEAEARIRAEKMKLYLPTLQRSIPATVNPPGYAPIADNVRALIANRGRPQPMMANGKPLPADPTIEELASAGILFWGTPDQVYDQLATFYGRIGGFGHLLMEGQAAALSHEEAVDSMKLFAAEIYPRLKELTRRAVADDTVAA